MTRKTVKNGFQVVVALALVAYATLARAEARGPLEIEVATGFTRGHGPAAGEMMPDLQDLAGNGASLQIGVGWRIDARWLVGTYAELGRLASGDEGSDGMTSAAAGIQGQIHLDPSARLDPWIGLGAGWRGLWLEHAAGTHVLQGLDLARMQVGLDYRVSDGLAIAPTVGIAVTQLLSEKRPGASRYSDIEDRKTGHFVFAGVSWTPRSWRRSSRWATPFARSGTVAAFRSRTSRRGWARASPALRRSRTTTRRFRSIFSSGPCSPPTLPREASSGGSSRSGPPAHELLLPIRAVLAAGSVRGLR